MLLEIIHNLLILNIRNHVPKAVTQNLNDISQKCVMYKCHAPTVVLFNLVSPRDLELT